MNTLDRIAPDRPVPFMDRGWFRVHLGMALGRMSRRAEWLAAKKREFHGMTDTAKKPSPEILTREEVLELLSSKAVCRQRHRDGLPGAGAAPRAGGRIRRRA